MKRVFPRTEGTLSHGPLKIFYFTSMDLPSPKAHALQILETSTALAHVGVEVCLIVSSIKGQPEEIWEGYGLAFPHDGVEIIPLAKKRQALSLMVSRKAHLAYTRSTRWARFLLNSKWLHFTPVVFETHRKFLYHRRDPETGLGKAKAREVTRLETIFNRAEGVVCGHGSTWERLRARGVKALLLWYGWTRGRVKSRGPSWKVGYAGYKEKDLLLKAAELVPGLELHLFGSPQEGEAVVGKSRVISHPFMPHGELMDSLSQTGVMVSLDEGLKIADYLSLGGAVVAPNLPSTREITGKGAAYFAFGSPDSLAGALKKLKENPCLLHVLKKASERRSDRYSWNYKALKLKGFLEEVSREGVRGVLPCPAVSIGHP